MLIKPVTQCDFQPDIKSSLPKQRWNKAISKVLELTKGMAEMRKKGIQGKILADEYWVEALAPSHPGPLLKNHLQREWRRGQSELCFLDWLDSDQGQQAFRDSRSRFAGYVGYTSQDIITHNETGKKIKLADLNKLKVLYLSEEERKSYQIGFKRDSEQKGYLVQNEVPFCTAKHNSHGKVGGAIFVVDSKGQFYAGTQVLNSFHHSSFLGGAPIMGGGELFVDEKGYLFAISNNTGHYEAGPEEMLNVLKLLISKGIDLSTVTLNLYNHSSNQVQSYNAQQYFLSSSSVNT